MGLKLQGITLEPDVEHQGLLDAYLPVLSILPHVRSHYSEAESVKLVSELG